MDVKFSDLTTLGIGGPIKEFVSVQTEEELINAIQRALAQNTPYLVIGGGSNLLVSDEGFDGIVIKNEIKGIHKVENSVIAKAGDRLQDLVDFANEHGLRGLENLAGIPGTLGGAIYGNAGAYGQTISDHLSRVLVFDPSTGVRKTLVKEECLFLYRSSIFKQNDHSLSSNGILGNKNIVLEAIFKLSPSDAKQLIATSKEIIGKREIKYPPGIKCPGSFFKNIIASELPKEILEKIPIEKVVYGKVPSGSLLEMIGAKGATLRNIKIAEYHANLFINEGGGNARDFYDLAKIYQQKVFEKFGIMLEPEVQLINLPPLS